MKIEILGCSGGIGQGLKTTTMLIEETLLLDAGSGVELLTMERLLNIRDVIITHAHLDHIIGLPLMLATIFEQHRNPIHVYALPEVISALQTHIFNWTIWPDYTVLPEENPIIRLHSIQVGDTFNIQNKTITVIPAEHPTPTAGYLIQADANSLLFTGDSGLNERLVPLLNTHQPNLLIIDVSFSDESIALAQLSGHLTPSMLVEQLQSLNYNPLIAITHLKPGIEERIMQQCLQLLPQQRVQRLEQGAVITLP
ncbi:3',5'-cyclic-nucleotide phosphodiesterase [Amphritea sp. 1_MG-2023]|uniref:3',5'-cyclic-nucleotide phosphodiesterase n=1 Tax=Amphritea sp. 1_MG-2023 TaxID=3062670 RepID=UPI0026E19DA3|nr:3',5'-cyclic-nucleotide phosphodiesterase [Amphritea sp. 1_MG-2023]MDO6564473.1 3',5'-cyclic-nucleotide phosphodiesterase [Amphritea sp. 1_MG-2023]